MIALGWLACAFSLGHPDVRVGAGEARLPLVHPSNDPRRLYVPVDAGDAGEWLLFVDTGYTATTCDDGFVAALAAPTGGRSTVRGELGALPTTHAQLPRLTVGPHAVDDLVCQTRDLHTTSSLADPPEVPIAGVLGMDVLRHFDVRIDGAWLVLTEPADASPAEAPTDAVRLRREWLVGPRRTVPARIDGRRDRLLLDTGATDTYVDGRRLGLTPSRTVAGVTVRGTGAAGAAVRDLVHYEVLAVDLGVTVGPVELTDRRRGPLTPGLLGLDVLDGVHQDYRFRRRWAVFTPAPRVDRPAWADRPPGDAVVVAPAD